MCYIERKVWCTYIKYKLWRAGALTWLNRNA